MILWGSGYSGPANRQEAVQQGRTGVCVTMADIEELHRFKHVHAPIRSRWDYEDGTFHVGNTTSTQWTPIFSTPSQQWDNEYFRWTHCKNPEVKMATPFPYAHGMLTGLWQGNYLVSFSCPYTGDTS